MTNTQSIRNQIVLILANKLWAGKSLAEVNKMSKKSLEEWETTIDAILATICEGLPKRKPLLGIKLDEPSKSVEISRNQGWNAALETVKDLLQGGKNE